LTPPEPNDRSPTAHGGSGPSSAAPQQTADAEAAIEAIARLAEACDYAGQHTCQVTRLALALFDELKIVHGLGPSERLRLHHAALLHDLGLVEGTKGYHKASLRTILESPLLPFGKRQRRIVG
jgi:exopolyphosphatase/guanosine-5'-triphosphate,3'-diphosphate pyrophosphatase